MQFDNEWHRSKNNCKFHFSTCFRRILIWNLQIQKKANCKRYKVLSNNIFTPLQTNLIEEINLSYVDIPEIRFDPLGVRNLPDYSEALKHLDKDITNFSDRFKGLEIKISKFNDDIKQFQKIDIYKKVSIYFQDNDFKVNEDDYPTSYPDNTVLIKLLTDKLKSLWYKKENFNLGIHNTNELRINGSIIIAKISNDKKDTLIHHIQCLKQYYPILKEYDNLLDTYKQIMDEGQNLSREINENVISKIDIGDYKTTCNQCGWFNFLHRSKK